MHRFYVDEGQIGEKEIIITGSDVNHIKNVLRMKEGETLVICNGHGKDCYCIIDRIKDKEIIAGIQSITDTVSELCAKIVLYQGLPKKDKMELIIQKAVELGVHEIVPVAAARCIVKYGDRKKEENRLERWQAIAESAAKQSGRGYIPQIRPIQDFSEAAAEAGRSDLALIPYELAVGMERTRELLSDLHKRHGISIMIGPEGGFEQTEIDLAVQHGIHPISLGRRILRTETAGLAVLSMIMLLLEE